MAIFALFLAAFTWGSAFCVLKDTLENVSPIWLLAFRFLLAGIIMTLVCIPRMKKMSIRTLKRGIIMGIVLYFEFLFFTVGLQYTTSSKSSFIIGSYVAILPLIYWVIRGKKPQRADILAALVCIVGLGFILLGSFDGVNKGDLISLLSAVCYAIHIVVTGIFAREEEKYAQFEKKSEDLYKANWREVMTFAIFRPSIYLVSVLAMMLVIGTGSAGVLNQTLSLGTLFIFITYISSFFDPIQELAEQFGTLQSSLASAGKIFSILDEKPDIVKPTHPVEVNIKGRIEFRHVWFAYEKDDYILKDISFVIEPGEKVAFVGATGAGKSSILNLIGRYFDIQKGEILIDGVNIKDIDTDVLRAAIGQVQQDVFIFTGDIKSNISLDNENISIEDVKRAAEIVHADSFIEKMPGGYDAPVTERGSTLSAGQRQLLSFARTLAYDPTILVLDEATANIDTETEALITSALAKLMEGRTTIMVAHRLSTIQHADKIIVMHQGQIKEAGTHQELLAQNGLYRKLYDLQLVEA